MEYSLDVGMDIGGVLLNSLAPTQPIMRKAIKFFHYGHFRLPLGSPKVTTVLQRRALAMNPRYIFVVSYQISSNMVASATAPLPWRVGSLFFVLVFAF